MHLRLMETFRNLFYTPIYVAVGGGFLYREGLDVSLGTAPTGRPAGNQSAERRDSRYPPDRTKPQSYGP